MGREAGTAYADQTAALHGGHQAGFVGDGGRHTGGVYRLGAVCLDGDGGGHGSVDHTQRGDALHRAGHAGVNVGADEPACLADDGTHLHGVTLLDGRLCRCADVHRHRDHNAVGNGHLHRSQPCCAFVVRDGSTLGGAL